jgi:hypothetical protein
VVDVVVVYFSHFLMFFSLRLILSTFALSLFSLSLSHSHACVAILVGFLFCFFWIIAGANREQKNMSVALRHLMEEETLRAAAKQGDESARARLKVRRLLCHCGSGDGDVILLSLSLSIFLPRPERNYKSFQVTHKQLGFLGYVAYLFSICCFCFCFVCLFIYFFMS